MSLSNVLVIGLFGSNSRMVIFFKTEKKFISQQTRKGPYIYDVHMEGECPHQGGSLKICHMSVYSFFFLKQKIYCVHFSLQMKVVGVTKLVIFCCHHKFITPKWFKITTNSTNRGSNFFCNIKPQARYILTA